MAQVDTELGVYLAEDAVGHYRMIQDLALNDNNKTLTVPAGVVWRVEWLSIDYTVTAAGGARYLRVYVTFPGPVTVWQTMNGAAAVNKRSIYLYSRIVPSYSSITYTLAIPAFDKYIPLTFPVVWLPPGATVEILDNGLNDPNDDLLISMMVTEYPTGRR